MVCKYDPIVSCNKTQAINYTPGATSDTSCIYTFGKGNCTDPKALNYNKNARNGDRSCVYDFTIRSCTDRLALNYNPNARRDDGSCIYTYGKGGCTEPTAFNYNPDAKQDDGSCLFVLPPPLGGCTNPKASNYDVNAIMDDGSCMILTVDMKGCTDPEALNYNRNAGVDDGSCVYDLGNKTGCIDPLALNYNLNAIIDDGSCTYSPDKLGCTDAKALNYSATAIKDDGSCKYTEPQPTLCLQREFGKQMPDFTNMTVFNNIYTLCSNAGKFTKTNIIINGSSSSFSGFCENSSSIDNNQVRCTYQVLLDDIVIEEPPFFITGTVTGTIQNLDMVQSIPLAGINVEMITAE